MERLDERAVDRISGPAWVSLRPQFEAIHAALIGIAPDVSGVLTTIYIKYSSPPLGHKPFAVVWVKKASEIVVGLALPVDSVPEALSAPPTGFKYAGLTGYFKVTVDDAVPGDLSQWAECAYEHTKNP